MEIKILCEDINGYGGKNGVKVYEQLLSIIKNVNVKFTDDSKSFRKEFLSPDNNISIEANKEKININNEEFYKIIFHSNMLFLKKNYYIEIIN